MVRYLRGVEVRSLPQDRLPVASCSTLRTHAVPIGLSIGALASGLRSPRPAFDEFIQSGFDLLNARHFVYQVSPLFRNRFTAAPASRAATTTMAPSATPTMRLISVSKTKNSSRFRSAPVRHQCTAETMPVFAFSARCANCSLQ
jgi:hypothetical protein